MNKLKLIALLVMILIRCQLPANSQNVFSISGDKTMLNGNEFLVIGLRCSNALLTDKTVNQLISHLDEYQNYGVNTISVFFMGSRYSNINGFNMDGTLKDIYKTRMAKIIEACDKREMVVLVGILYWGAQQHDLSNANYSDWTQEHANTAMVNTIKWLNENNYKNVFVDPDNEGMAERGAGFRIDEMICEGKKVDPSIHIAYNSKGFPPPCADLAIHHANITKDLPYIQSEGTPSQYWGDYSKESGLDHYINVGIYTASKKTAQLKDTQKMLDEGHGYMFASTWLQNVPPNYSVGGDGSPCDPGMLWWLEFIKEHYKK